MKTTILILTLLVSLNLSARENPSVKNSSPINQVTVSNCNPPSASMDLHINNVRAMVLAGADMWWDLTNAQYEVPDSSGKHSMFAASLWIGGVDAGGQILQRHKHTGKQGLISGPEQSIQALQISHPSGALLTTGTGN